MKRQKTLWLITLNNSVSLNVKNTLIRSSKTVEVAINHATNVTVQELTNVIIIGLKKLNGIYTKLLTL